MPATATYNLTGNAYIDGLLSGIKWAPTNLTYSFPTSASYYGSGYGSGEPGSNFGALNSAQQAAGRAAFDIFSSVANITFSEIAETSNQHADLRLAASDMVGTAWAYYPSTRSEGGDVWFNKSNGYYTSPQAGNYAFTTFLHEIGHALGLEHAHEGHVMPASRDSMEYTVMSYRSYVGASTTSGYVNEKWGFAQTLMMYDIAALQHMYGANYSTHSGATTYSWSPTTGQMFINGTGQDMPGANRIFLTVWDGGGADTYNFSAYSTSLKVDLRPGAWTTTSSDQLARLHYDGSKLAAGNIANALLHENDARSLIENAKGGSAGDRIIGNTAANKLWGNGGNDTLSGMEGNDVLIGGAGADKLNGGSGFDYASYTDATAGVVARLYAPTTNKGYAAGDTYTSIEGLIGSAHSDQLYGDEAGNRLHGGAGNDVLYGRGGNDALYGVDGNDKLFGSAGADKLDGGAGFDYASYQDATAGVLARLDAPKANSGHAAGDTYSSIEGLIGSKYSDKLYGDAARNKLFGGAGNDVLYGLGGNDALYGMDGTDKLVGSAGADKLDGGAGFDYASYQDATAGVVARLDRPSSNTGYAAGDTYTGIEGLMGSKYTDKLYGDAAANRLYGDAGNDVLYGLGGNDVLIGGAGADRLYGSAGADRFVIDKIGNSLPTARDRIGDFTRGEDKIDLRSIDANTSLGGDQAFSFIGGKAFSGKAGELNFAGNVLSGDVNGDRIADFQVDIPNVSSLLGTDFYL